MRADPCRRPHRRSPGTDPSTRGGRPGMPARATPLAAGVLIEVWSDVVCPVCYIGKRRLETALARFPHRDEVEVVWRSFQLDPTVPEGEVHATLPELARKYGRPEAEMRSSMEQLNALAAAEGLDYDLA